MAILPNVDIRVLIPNEVVAGTRLDGVVELECHEDVARAEHLYFSFRSNAWALYGSVAGMLAIGVLEVGLNIALDSSTSGGHSPASNLASGSRQTIRRDLFTFPLTVDFPKGVPLPRGTHRYPFSIELPAWLPPNMTGPDCAIEHRIDVRLDVDWATDPTKQATVVIVAPRSETMRMPVTVRSPAKFHDNVVVEVSLDSAVLPLGEPLRGTIAIREGKDARFDDAVLTLKSVAKITMGSDDARTRAEVPIRVPGAKLRTGEPVPFEIPALAMAALLPSFRNGYIDHEVILDVALDIAWAIDPSFPIAIALLPRGSRLLDRSAPLDASGAEGHRLHDLAQEVTAATGLQPGALPLLATGAVGAALVRVSDGPRGGRPGVDMEIEYPAGDIGIQFRPRGPNEAGVNSPLLPSHLARGYLLRVQPREAGRPIMDEPSFRAFLDVLLRGSETADEIGLDDHHLRFHFPLTNVGAADLIQTARFAQTQAQAILGAIGKLPFPRGLEEGASAWATFAAEQNAFLTPSGPSISGILVRGARIDGGAESSLWAAIHTEFRGGEPITRADVDLRGAPLGDEACAELGRASGRLDAVRATFAFTQALGREHITLERPGFTRDPRTLLPALAALLAWSLETRADPPAARRP